MQITTYQPGAGDVDPARFRGRVYLVTGAAGAIGSAVSLALAGGGATVILLDRNDRGLDTIYDRIAAECDPEPAKLVLDLADAGGPQFEELAELIGREFRRLDGIIHCATEPGTLTPLAQYPLDSWNRALLVNLNAPYMLTRACLGLLRQAEDACVVFTTADVARQGRAYWGAYGVTGHALEGLASIWAEELESNTTVRVNTLDPGPVRSAFRSRHYPGELPDELPGADRVVPAYLYLLAEPVTGLALRLQLG